MSKIGKNMGMIIGIIGGVWGVISGVIYAFVIFGVAFASMGVDMGEIFEIFRPPVLWKIILLPAYLTDILGGLLVRVEMFIFFGMFGLIVYGIGIPTLFGIIIGSLVATVIKKVITK